MKMTRLRLMCVLLSALLVTGCKAGGPGAATAMHDATPIDRHALVSRHDVVVHRADPVGTLAVGNGDFAFNADITGLQTFPDYYAKTLPLGILSDWAWHSFPNPNHYGIDTFLMTAFQKHGRQIWLPYTAPGVPMSDEAVYLRANPHRLGLGQIGLEMTRADGSPVAIGDLTNIDQHLDLWGGILISQFEIDGTPVRVETAAHPQRDEVAVRVISPLLASGRMKISIAFSYPSGSAGVGYDDWNRPEAHQTALELLTDNDAIFHRTVDATEYDVRARWSAGATLAEASDRKHRYELRHKPGADRLELTAWFSPTKTDHPADSVDDVQSAARQHWRQFWTTGGAIDLSGNADPRAAELERRIVLSQYVTAVQCANRWPAQETGLACNSWYGKFHLEMYWWHAAHFALWGRPELLERSLAQLDELLPEAEATARRDGCQGARWQKMTSPAGAESPSPINALLVWQQPHPIYLAELAWRAHRDRATLERYSRIVFESADFMATFLDYDPQRKQYVLGPAIMSADEKHRDIEHTINPTMELGYWQWGLETAQQWRLRMGMERNADWDHVLKNLAPLPIRNGVYPVLESPTDPGDEEGAGASFMATWLAGPIGLKNVDRAVMRRTLDSAAAQWKDHPQTWGMALMAMCAARMDEPDLAIDLLVGQHGNNTFLPSGDATGYHHKETPVYFPVNGGWLAATAMMAAGWDGGPDRSAPGFPKTWHVRYEGLAKMP